MVHEHMNKTWISLLAISGTLALTSCAHQSKVTPSTGHIDSQSPAQQTQASATPAASDIPKLVTSITYLPPPTPKAKEQTYSVVVNEVPVKEILFALARESKLNIDIHPSIQGRVTLNAVDQTLPAILERLSKQVDLTYKVENNVLSIAPDHPVLRTYKVDYVNMSRDTKGFIGAAAEISGTGQGVTTTGGGSSSSSSGSSSSGSSENSSRTSVKSESLNRFWESLEKNVKELLEETDKEIIISREVNPPVVDSDTAETNERVTSQSLEQQRQRERTEYKTLFAATVISNREAGVITVRGTNKQHEKVQEFLGKVLNSAKRQVLIEATIVEVELSDSFQAGIDWGRVRNSATNSGFEFSQSLGSNASFDSTTGRFTAGGQNAFGVNTTAGFVAGYINPAGALGNIFGAISLLKQFGDTKVLSSPKLMVLNNQSAVLKVVDNLVYFTITGSVNQSQVNSTTSFTSTPNTIPVGLIMSVTPHIDEGSAVMLNVRPTISSLLSFVLDPNPSLLSRDNNGNITGRIESRVPQVRVREMESILRVQSGDITVLGGLMQDEIIKNTDQVPGLSDIPVAGKVFTGKNDGTRKKELVIFLRPTVINSASLESDELQSYKQYLPSQQLQQSLDEPAY
jgi:MSHA biogenesis protein MshL